MDPISNADRLAALLRQRLAERASSDGKRRGEGVATGAAPPRRRTAVEALASTEGIDDRQLRRAVVENILADQFGQELLNEAKFQQVVDRVTNALGDDPGTARLLSRVVAEMRRPAR